MSLALSTLIYEWRRYLTAVIAIAMAGLLVLAMTGMFMGASKSFTATVDRSPAEVMVLPPDADSLFSNNSGQPRRLIPELYGHADVVEVQPLNIGGGSWSNFPKEGQTAKSDQVNLVIIDPVRGSINLPNDFDETLIRALQEPYSLVLDRSSLRKLGVQQGDRAKLNNSTVYVGGITTGYASTFGSMAFTSTQTAKLLHMYDDGPRVGPIMVKIRDSAKADQVALQLNAMSKGRYKAWTRDALSSASERSILNDGGIMIMVGFAVVVGSFIGVIITWQTLQGAILANIKEFASLRALGVSMGSLRRIVMELSFWVGIAGLALTAGLTTLVWAVAAGFGVPLAFPLFVVIPVGAALLIIAMVSGALSLGVLKKGQPADLLR